MKLCSACLLGIKCRYDGSDKANEKVLALAKKETLVPVCPEQLRGLLTPREQTEIRGDRVFTKSGVDVTANFKIGAEQVLKIAKARGITTAILKQKSPSCGCGKIYDGTFSGVMIEGDGVMTKLLKKNGIEVLTEDDLY
ncbi:MAG: DUF523 domain-containing protein [Parcubacteria group bacterium]|jgi:uncharacterized protein YbbK (DUF523 family)